MDSAITTSVEGPDAVVACDDLYTWVDGWTTRYEAGTDATQITFPSAVGDVTVFSDGDLMIVPAQSLPSSWGIDRGFVSFQRAEPGQRSDDAVDALARYWGQVPGGASESPLAPSETLTALLDAASDIDDQGMVTLDGGREARHLAVTVRASWVAGSSEDEWEQSGLEDVDQVVGVWIDEEESLPVRVAIPTYESEMRLLIDFSDFGAGIEMPVSSEIESFGAFAIADPYDGVPEAPDPFARPDWCD